MQNIQDWKYSISYMYVKYGHTKNTLNLHSNADGNDDNNYKDDDNYSDYNSE